MGTYAANAVIAVIGTVMLLPVAMLPILAIVTRRYGALRGWPLVASAGLLGSTVALAAFTIFPLPAPNSLACSGGTLSSYWQTEWFGTIGLIGDAWASMGLPAVLGASVFLQALFNVLLFVPYGFFLHQVTRWRGLSVVIAGLVTSVVIEVTQGTGVFGLYPCPYRVLDVDDLILNTLGVGIGVLASLIVRRRPWSRPVPVPDLERPTVPRRIIAAGIDLGLLLFVAGAAKAVWVQFVESPPPAEWVFDSAAAVVLVLLVPLLRCDHGTLGQFIVNVAPTRGLYSATRASAISVFLRAAVRWAPIVAFGALGLLAVLIADFAALLSTQRRRSFAGLASHSVMRTKPAILASADTQLLDSQPLLGGNMSGPVTRVGNTVRKPHQPQSDTVQRLVAHARARGVSWAAEPLGRDDAGNDVWGYIPGDVSHAEPHDDYPDAVVTDVAARLRQWHDATLTFPRSPNDVWWQPGKFPAEVICHVDFAPYNHVFRDGRFVGAIDFDVCYPGPRLWDLAYTAYRYVPLTPDADETTRERRLQRLDGFLAAYAGGDHALTYTREQLLSYAVQRLVAMAQWCEQQESADRQRDGVMYRKHAQWIAAGGLGVVDPTAVADLPSSRR
jgi:glycopeptide antibiotics resistance protein